MSEPRLLLLDEATKSLDYESRIRAWACIGRELDRLKGTLVFATHDPQEACHFATRLIAIQDGALLYDGPPQGFQHEDLIGEGLKAS